MERLGNILSRLKLPGPGPLQLEQVHEALRAVLGEAAARDVRPASLRKGKLVLEVVSAARAFEYQAFAKGVLLAQLKERPGLESLIEVNFKNGAWRRHGGE